MQDVSLVQIHRAVTPAEAEVVKGVLDDAGIEAFVPGETTPVPLSSRLGVAGCEVLVAAADEEQARAALTDARAAGALEGEPEFDGSDEAQPEVETE